MRFSLQAVFIFNFFCCGFLWTEEATTIPFTDLLDEAIRATDDQKIQQPKEDIPLPQSEQECLAIYIVLLNMSNQRMPKLTLNCTMLGCLL
jgi:hypothetical protein